VLGLYRLPLRGGPLFVGWLAGMFSGTSFFVWAGLKPVLAIPAVGAIYIAIISLALNLLISLGGSMFRKMVTWTFFAAPASSPLHPKITLHSGPTRLKGWTPATVKRKRDRRPQWNRWLTKGWEVSSRDRHLSRMTIGWRYALPPIWHVFRAALLPTRKSHIDLKPEFRCAVEWRWLGSFCVFEVVKIQTSITEFFPDPVIRDHRPIVEFLAAGRYNPIG
jgi:hypothetical protein